jgi:antirestriction protein
MARIYVASLSDYNNGLLLGTWIDLDGKDADDVQDEIAAMLRTSKHPNLTVECPKCGGAGWVFEEPDNRPAVAQLECPTCKGTGKVPSAEEWSIHDYDDCPDMGENPSLDDLLEQVRLLDEHGDAWEAYVECVGTDYATEEGFESAQAGSANSEEGWLEDYMESAGTLDEMPDHLRNYFDDRAYLRDMKLNGDVSFEVVNGTTYAFWNN